ncbi:MAG: Na+/H+ antiporter NhaC family protein [Coraliomargaritaceae bacterium]
MQAFTRNQKHQFSIGILLATLLISALLGQLDRSVHLWLTLWPSVVALGLVFVFRSAFAGLLAGAVCGSLLMQKGYPLDALTGLVAGELLPIFQSPWKLSAVAFTLILGGFVALVEAGGGLQALVRRMLGTGRAPAKRMQLTVFGFGLLVFFDGLANTMLIGRLLRGAADRCGVSRVKLAYLADATGSAVACLAFVSTWIAFQLSMIREGYAAVGREVGAYGLFFQSLPMNFYCWFALVMALVSVLRSFNPGPMGVSERAARSQRAVHQWDQSTSESSGWWRAIVPILVVTLSIPLICYWIGADTWFPFSLAKFAQAYAAAENSVPWILIGASLAGSLVAAFLLVVSGPRHAPRVAPVFFSGVRELLGPVAILLAAWLLGGVISSLGAAEVLGLLLKGNLAPQLLPLVIFAVGSLISFSTGTSWGTMGVLMPLAIPVVFHLTGETPDAERDRLVIAAIGAVFSGAVFGDHCSPFSDTTIVASIAAGVEPLDHVRTQLPFAWIAGLVACLFGFLPLGYGLPVWICLLLGASILCLIPSFWRKHHG